VRSQLLEHILQAQCNYSCLCPTCMASTFDGRIMLRVEYACMLSLQAFPTRKLNCGHACFTSCHLTAPLWVLIIITIIMQCNAKLTCTGRHPCSHPPSTCRHLSNLCLSCQHVHSSECTPHSSPTCSATHAQSPHQKCSAPLGIALDTNDGTFLTFLGCASSALVTTARQVPSLPLVFKCSVQYQRY